MFRKQFVTKDNEERWKNEIKMSVNPEEPNKLPESAESYASFNRKMIIREFIGYKLYQLVCNVPKVYISYDDSRNLFLNSQKLSKTNSASLGTYLQDVLKPSDRFPDQYSAEEKKAIADKLNKLDGIGPVLFMSLLLGDRDVIGVTLENLFVVNNQVIYKIDPADIAIPLAGITTVTDEEDAVRYTKNLEKNLPEFITNKNPNLVSQTYHPYVSLFLSILNEEQIQAGIAAIKSVMQEERLRKDLDWIVIKLIASPNPNIADDIIKVMQSRSRIITGNYDPENIIEPHEVNNIKQRTIVRPATDFESSSQRIEVGSSQPLITLKHTSLVDKMKVIEKIHEELKAIIADLGLKIEKLTSTESDEKMLKITMDALAAYQIFYEDIKLGFYDQSNRVRKDIANISDKFLIDFYNNLDKTNNQFLSQLKESDNRSTIDSTKMPRRSVSDSIKQLPLIKSTTARLLRFSSFRINPEINVVELIEKLQTNTHRSFDTLFKRKGITMEDIIESKPKLKEEHLSENKAKAEQSKTEEKVEAQKEKEGQKESREKEKTEIRVRP